MFFSVIYEVYVVSKSHMKKSLHFVLFHIWGMKEVLQPGRENLASIREPR